MITRRVCFSGIMMWALAAGTALGQGDAAFLMGDGRTGEKPQSKVWFYDGAWWAVLPGTVSGQTAHRIYRYDGKSWRMDSRENVVDERIGARADVIRQSNKLFVLSFHPRESRFLVYEYEVEKKRYLIREGYPVTLAPLPLVGIETMVLTRDGSGRFWAAYEGEPGPGRRGEVRVIWSEDVEGRKWNLKGTRLGGNLDADDIAAAFVQKGGSQIGVCWSQQLVKRTADTPAGLSQLVMRSHRDGDAPERWGEPEIFASGLGRADDHLNLAVGRDGTIFLATKTSLDDLKPPDPEAPQIQLYVKRPGEKWTGYPVSPVREGSTRPIVVLEEDRDQLYVFYTRIAGDNRSVQEIVYRRSDIHSVDFSLSPQIAIAAPGIYLNDVTSTRENVTAQTGLMVVCWGEVRNQKGSRRAYFRLLKLGGR